jgi:hypothetical protein
MEPGSCGGPARGRRLPATCAEVKARAAQLGAATAAFDRVRNGPRPGGIELPLESSGTASFELRVQFSPTDARIIEVEWPGARAGQPVTRSARARMQS